MTQNKVPPSGPGRNFIPTRQGMLTLIMETFGVSRSATVSGVLLVAIVGVAGALWFVRTAPPDTITITSGPEGSIFQTNAVKYAAILARSKVKVNIIPSNGSLENLQRLSDPSFKADVGFVQGGMTNGVNIDKLVSLGSISYQPMLLFYRGDTMDVLSQLKGKKLAIGPVGSGTRSLALTLLEWNGIVPGGPTTLLDIQPEAASEALLKGEVDAVFLMGEAASPAIMRKLLRTPGVQIYNFTQAVAYTRRMSYLNILQLPRGSIDFGSNLPPHDVNLLGPTVELIARETLHPAMSDLLLEAAKEAHNRSTLLQKKGEFPAPLEHEFRISEDAARFYKTGKTFLYRNLPFWLASVVNRIVVVIVPMMMVLIPGLRVIPKVYRWRVRSRIYRWYRALLVLERELSSEMSEEKRDELLTKLDSIETAVNAMKVPASFADQFYGLRGHIGFVRERLRSAVPHPLH